MIKNSLANCKGIKTSPLNLSAISMDPVKPIIPSELIFFLKNIIGDKIQNKILSVAQDIINTKSNKLKCQKT